MLTLLADVIAGGAVEPVPLTPFWDVCSAAQCCVQGRAASYYLPWRSNVTEPSWWEPFLAWQDVFILIAMSFGMVVLSCVIGCCFLQAVWLKSKRGEARRLAFRAHRARATGRANMTPTSRRARTTPRSETPLANANRPSEAPVHGSLGESGIEDHPDPYKQLSLDELRGDVARARTSLEEHYGDSHFQPSAMDACVSQILGLLDSRARRHQGYSARCPTEPSPESGADIERQALMDRAADMLDKPRSMPLRDADALWQELMENLLKWISTADLCGCGLGRKERKQFTVVQQLLREHGGELKQLMRDLQSSSSSQGPSTPHFQMLLLYLLMGSDNVLRTAPECICLLFSVYACELRFADPSDEHIGQSSHTLMENFRKAI